MASKFGSRKSKGLSFPFFVSAAYPLNLVIALLSIILLAGCQKTATNDNIIQRKSPEERKAELLKSLGKNFENADAHYELGKLYHAERQWSEAEWRYKKALSFDPVHWPAQAAMVKLFIDCQDPVKARNYADIYINNASSSPSQSLDLALAFQHEGLDLYAMNCFQQALNLAPNSPEIHKKIGYYYLSRNDKAQAKEYFTRSFQLNPNQPEVAGELGRLGVEVRIPSKTEQDTNN
ncbi:MAG: hypothetical protein JW715_17080 [Sedimentisphaerales bacterium]|nr:hypothetical protein [Sedimentisphaerales bacterium]